MICRPINYIGHSAKTLSSTARAYNSENNVSTDYQVKSNQRTFKILLCREQEAQIREQMSGPEIS